MRRRVVEKFDNERVFLERVLNDPALYASTAAVHEPNLAQTGRLRRLDVFDDDRRDVGRSEGMKIERVFDGDAVWFLLGHRGSDETGLS